MRLTDPAAIQMDIPILGIAAFSGTGKTTLLEAVIPKLTAAGIRVGAVKASHHIIDPDQPGKDSYRLRQAGAQQLVLSTPQRSICFVDYPADHERSLAEQLQLLNHRELDLILVEGFRDAPIPKIELHRQDYTESYLFTEDSWVIAVACDSAERDDLPESMVMLDINNSDSVAQFILQFINDVNGKSYE